MNTDYEIRLRINDSVCLNQLFDDLKNVNWKNFNSNDKFYTDSIRLEDYLLVKIDHDKKVVILRQ